MSRFLLACSLACSLVAGLGTSALAAPVAPVVPAGLEIAPAIRFAQPPAATPVDPDRAPASRLHLQVERAEVRAALLANRRANLARFRAYRLAGVYPSNVYMAGLANVWRDQDGRLCAAATIIRASGEEALVEATAAQDNAIQLAAVDSGPLHDWILTSGLTQAELVAIQRPFRAVTLQPEPAPVEPVLVDARLRKAETARLARLYRQIEARLVKQQRASVEAAVDRLMARPALAAQLVNQRG